MAGKRGSGPSPSHTNMKPSGTPFCTSTNSSWKKSTALPGTPPAAGARETEHSEELKRHPWISEPLTSIFTVSPVRRDDHLSPLARTHPAQAPLQTRDHFVRSESREGRRVEVVSENGERNQNVARACGIIGTRACALSGREQLHGEICRERRQQGWHAAEGAVRRSGQQRALTRSRAGFHPLRSNYNDTGSSRRLRWSGCSPRVCGPL